MTVLSAQSIDARVMGNCPHVQRLGIEPYVQKAAQYRGMSFGLTSAGYDIRMGSLGDSKEAPALYIGRGEFVLVASLERLKIPNDLQVIVHDKSSWARKGLTVQNTVLEPGWEGFITLELHNQGRESLTIFRGAPIAQLVFHKLDKPTMLPYRGKYQNQGSEPLKAIESGDATL